jgi:hypothetical protein
MYSCGVKVLDGQAFPHLYIGLCLGPKRSIDGKLVQESHVDGVRGMAQDLAATCGDAIDAAAWGVNEPCLFQMALGPGDAIGEERLLATGQQLRPLCGGELQEPSQNIQGLLSGMLLPISNMLQEWEHETLKIWNWHSCTCLQRLVWGI